jgi:N-dimethylarginine dimethylaminohydrolase
MHRPGKELRHSARPDEVLMLEPLDAVQAGVQHDAVASAYKLAGVKVHYVEPPREPPPNQMFCADLLFATPEGVILGRQASAVRAGEERWVARRLGDLGIPIIRTVSGHGVFEGADAQWIATDTVLLCRGLRTNAPGAAQVASALREMDVEPIEVDAVPGTMHLMGQLRLVDAGRAVIWPGGLSGEVEALLQERGYELLRMPDEAELRRGLALNFVLLGPGHVLMPAGNPRSQAFLEASGVTCQVTAMDELAKAAGGIGCLTGVLWREPVASPRSAEALPR